MSSSIPLRRPLLQVVPLDLAAKVDEAADFLVGGKWKVDGEALSFPPPFGRTPYPEEEYVKELDSKTGASLKLTILNPRGRVWTMVAGGGASVVYADTITDLGFGRELANYGEYSGAPSEDMTFEYAKTIISLLVKSTGVLDPSADEEILAKAAELGAGGATGGGGLAPGSAATAGGATEDRVLIIGGGIANFTDVAKTFRGIMRALRAFKFVLQRARAHIWVRRGGPNYEEGLRMMRDLGKTIGVPVHVYGPETHITAIVPLALGIKTDDALVGRAPTVAGYTAPKVSPSASPSPPPPTPIKTPTDSSSASSASGAAGGGGGGSGATMGGAGSPTIRKESLEDLPAPGTVMTYSPSSKPMTVPTWQLFHKRTRAIVFGMQTQAVQGMLDFDYICKRDIPSVAAMVFPFSGDHFQKFYWGSSETMLPCYSSTAEALAQHPDVDVFINFASFRSAYTTSMEAMDHPQIRTVAIIAEGVPEHQTRHLIRVAGEKRVNLVGPATVGGITPGCFKIGVTGGMNDNIIASKLYRPGSVAYVSKSGGMSNELNNIMARFTDGVCEGVAIGGDRFPGSRFLDHILRYQANPNVKMIVLLGEVGGLDEYEVANAIRDGRVTKPVVAWCIGTCADVFPFEVQFGHAGALAGSTMQTAVAKNAALREAGAVVPSNFNDFVTEIHRVFTELVAAGTIVVREEEAPPKIPMDYEWAKQLGLIRKPSSFTSTISDDRGEELLYAGMPISRVFEEDIGIGGVISLLWFKRRLPPYASRFLEMVLMITADHGPAVAGAHNTIVTTRAGKDIVSSLCSGLLTIGPRFGGALDDAALMFTAAYDSGKAPEAFVKEMRAANQLIMGIGHRVKSIHNPDKRVEIIKAYAHEHFPETRILDYAIEVEKITTQKKPNLILNVDGAIAACFVDLVRTCGAFTKEEADEIVKSGCLNGLFVLGRSIGLMGHFLDQKRLNQPLYRHPTEDINYLLPTDL